MPTTLPVYPGRDLLRGLGYSQKWSPSFFNQSATTATGASINVALSQYPLHAFELTYEFLRDGAGPGFGPSPANLEFRTMMGFHLQIGGTVGRFLYRNIDDQQVWQQPIGIGDGITTTFTLIRFFGANGYGASEPIGEVDVDAGLNVYLGGSAIPTLPTLYSISRAIPGANTITFATAPAPGQAITLDMSYFYYCRLADDSNTFEKFMNRLWNLQKVTLQSCRAGA